MSEVEEIAQSILDGLRMGGDPIPASVSECVSIVRKNAEGEGEMIIHAVADSLYETILREDKISVRS